VSDNIEKDATAIAGQHDLSGFRPAFKLGIRGETGIIQNFSQID